MDFVIQLGRRPDVVLRVRCVHETAASQRQFPRLADEIVAEAHMRLFANQTETGILIDPPRAGENALRPERHRLVAARTSERDAFGDQRVADPESARARRDDQEPQLGDLVRALTTNTEPTGSPSISAIQQCSRSES